MAVVWKWSLEKLVITIVATLLNRYDMFCVVEGTTGCLAGDTEIQVNRAKLSRRYTLKRLYENYRGIARSGKKFDLNVISKVRAFNGEEIKLHSIKDVVYSGKKEVFELILENGLNIKATKDHKIMTDAGWIELGNLKLNDKIMVDTLKAEKSKRRRYKLRDIGINGGYHPYNNQKNRQIAVHRLIYEAHINNLSLFEFLDIIWNEPDCKERLKFVDPEIYHIHHKDGNHYNNAIENLEQLMQKEHLKKFDNAYQNFSQGVPKFSQVRSIKYVGIEDTYDIICDEPYHNFVANGIVVHNSGKSTLALLLAIKVRRVFKRLKKLDYETVKFYYNLLELKYKGISEEDFCLYLLDLDKENSYNFRFKRDLIYNKEELQRFLDGWRGIAISDEMINVTFNRDFMSEEQKNIIKLLNMMRDHNNFTLACVPSFNVLDNQIKNLCKMRLSILRRGIAMIQTPNKTFYGRDIWDTSNNEKIERDWLVKKTKKPQYARLTTFRGIVKFPKLAPSIEAKYQKVKDAKRSKIVKDEMGMDTKKEDVTSEDRLFNRLLAGGIKNMQVIEGIALAEGITPEQMKGRIRRRLEKEGKNTSLTSYFWDKKAKEEVEIKGLEWK